MVKVYETLTPKYPVFRPSDYKRELLTGVGSKTFIEEMKDALGFRATGRRILCADDTFELQETITPYGKDNDLDSGNTEEGSNLLLALNFSK